MRRPQGGHRWLKLASVAVAFGAVSIGSILLLRGNEHGSAVPSPPATVETSTTVAPTTSTSSTSTTSTSTTTTIPPYMPTGPVAAIGTGAPLPVISRINTTDPVVFLTIDDGHVRDPRALELVEKFQIPVTAFLNEGPLRADPEYFQRITAFGGSINSHTKTHPWLTKISANQQRDEICGMRRLISQYVYAPGHFFRAPYGALNATTRSAAANCGMNAIFQWTATINNGYIDHSSPDGLRPGEIVLTHFRPDLYDNIIALWWAAGAKGLRLASLDGYVPLPE